MKEPEYQELDLDLPLDVRPLTAEFFVNWLIECHGLPESSRETVISNLKRDYQRMKLAGALEQAMKHPQVVVNNHYKLL